MASFPIDTVMGLHPCPEHVVVIGGGRWARVLSEVLCGILPPSVRASVHSLHNAELMLAWASEHGLGARLHVSSKWPDLHSGESAAVIVANAAHDHERAIEWALSADIPVLAEKPIALGAAASQRLATLARSRNIPFAAAHVLLFASYLDNFSARVAEAGKIQSIRVDWMDPLTESRYGELKHYDPRLPIFADLLPHILSMAGRLVPSLPQKCEKLAFFRGGAHLELELTLGGIPCRARLVRNGDRRQRIIEVTAGNALWQLDFSTEPGAIAVGSTTTSGDSDWGLNSRPLSRMLTAFLQWAAGGQADPRLDVEVGLRASRVIDETLTLYRSAQLPWLIERLASQEPVDTDVRYALCEILQAKGLLPGTVIEEQIARLRKQIAGTTDSRWLRKLSQARDPSLVLGAIAR